MTSRRLLSFVGTATLLAGALSSAPASAQTATFIEPLPAIPIVRPQPLPAADSTAIARKWGIRIESLRLTAAGRMLDFRYRVVDARKAKPLFVRKTKPVLRDEASGLELQVPVPPKTGALRNSNPPRAGKTYFMFFANPGVLKPGSKVTITIGPFSVGGLEVTSEPDAVKRRDT